MSYGRIRTALVAASACLVIPGALALGEPAFAAYPGANGKIAYESDDGDDFEIFVMNADGSGQTNITTDSPPDPVPDFDPTWSPDGQKIAFAREAEGHMNIMVMNANGSDFNLTPGPELTGQANGGIQPTWSPDGTKIAWNHSGDIWVMDAASGTGKVRLEFGAGLETWPAWSPDGTQIAFTRSANIWVGDAGGDPTPTLLTTMGGSEVSPNWSPDGSRITFGGPVGDIWVMNANGSGQTNLTTGLDESGALSAWSPDNTRLVFDSTGFEPANDGYDIFTMNPDGTAETQLTTGTANGTDPDWQPVAVPGGYPRPKGATPVRVSLVPAYAACTASNRTHGPPLAHPSCNPPALASSQLTVGTPDANGQPANSSGFAQYTAIVGAPGGADDSDVGFRLELTDVRHQGTLADYTGELQAAAVVRITDRLGGPANEAGTVVDFEHKLTVPCTATGGAVGATCAGTTTLDAIVPGTIKEGKRAIWQLGQVRVNDGGPDGLASTTPNTLFAVQGVFVP